MKAQFKCSNCGAEISNLNMSWGKKQWLWFIPFFIFIICMPFIMKFIMEDKSDFRADLTLKDIEKNYLNGTIEIFGIVENKGKTNWENIIIEAELFDKNGKFIDEIDNRLYTNLLPGTSEHFKISSKDFPESRWQSIDNLKVKISDAYHPKF
jgi:hypothetical protein